MELLIVINMFICPFVVGMSIFYGLNLRKWVSWFIILYCFVSGFLLGFLVGNFSTSSQAGIIFALAAILGGTVNRYHRQKYSREAAEDWLEKYGNKKQYSLLAQFMKKLLRK